MQTSMISSTSSAGLAAASLNGVTPYMKLRLEPQRKTSVDKAQAQQEKIGQTSSSTSSTVTATVTASAEQLVPIPLADFIAASPVATSPRSPTPPPSQEALAVQEQVRRSSISKTATEAADEEDPIEVTMAALPASSTETATKPKVAQEQEFTRITNSLKQTHKTCLETGTAEMDAFLDACRAENVKAQQHHKAARALDRRISVLNGQMAALKLAVYEKTYVINRNNVTQLTQYEQALIKYRSELDTLRRDLSQCIREYESKIAEQSHKPASTRSVADISRKSKIKVEHYNALQDVWTELVGELTNERVTLQSDLTALNLAITEADRLIGLLQTKIGPLRKRLEPPQPQTEPQQGLVSWAYSYMFGEGSSTTTTTTTTTSESKQ